MTPERFALMPQQVYAYGFPRWKMPVVRQCFSGRRVIFVPKDAPLPTTGWLVLWGMAQVPHDVSAEVKVVRMEDGFLRSVGLGADIIRPISWVLDTSGIYYDATRSSDLETILATHVFDAALLERARQLRGRIIAAGLTKYNTGATIWRRPPYQKRVILVPGQVESDASIAYGAPGIRTNMELLRAVRERNPEAYLIYKPHPDVLARLRLEGKGEKEAHRWCDEVVSDVVMGELLNVVDEVHVLTSLAGFEALLRGKPVTCYGHPFYAGWGLTDDVLPLQRRNRNLNIDELVAGALMEYPLYLSRDGKRLITSEEALESLADWRKKTGGAEPWWRDIFRVFVRHFAGVR